MFDQRLSSRRSPYWVERGASRRQAKSGSCEPRIAKPKGKGSAVPKIKDVPESAIAA